MRIGQGQQERFRRRLVATLVTVLIVAGCGTSSGTGSGTGTPGTGTAASGSSQSSAAPTPLPPISPTPSPRPGGIFVDPGADLGAISPYVYGSNFGPWLAMTPEQEPYVQQAGIKFLTWPGGNWGDENDITEMQLDNFIAMCRKLGAEPRIVVRVKDGSVDKAVALLTYANVTKGYKVKYWGIGNETDLYQLNGRNYTVDQFNADYRAYAIAMRKVDPSIKLIGPDVSQFAANATDPYMQARVDWLKSFLKADSDLVDVVSIHRYPFGGDNEPTVDKLRDNSKEWDETIPALRQLIRDQTGRDIPVAVTELNSSWSQNNGGDATMDSHYNAIWFGDVLGRLIRQDVFAVAQFALTGDYAIVDKYGPWPIWNVYVMYGQFGTERLGASSDDPYVTVYAAKRSDGTITVMLVNLGSSAATKPLSVAGLSGGPAETWQFTKDHPAAKASPTTLGGSVTLPPESMTLLVIAKP